MKYVFITTGFITVEADNPDDAFDLATELLTSSEDVIRNECESITIEVSELFDEVEE